MTPNNVIILGTAWLTGLVVFWVLIYAYGEREADVHPPRK